MSSELTTHVLDTALGRPAVGIAAVLEAAEADGFRKIAEGRTDADGRIRDLLAPGTLKPGVFRLTFAVGAYFAESGRPTFFDSIPIQFVVSRTGQHFHVPLLLSPFGYSTYRGS